jgi:hypothetical protein
MANAQSGLCAVYLARVGAVENGKIVGWASSIEIWRLQDGFTQTSPAGNQRPPAEETVEPVVTLVKKTDEQTSK